MSLVAAFMLAGIAVLIVMVAVLCRAVLAQTHECRDRGTLVIATLHRLMVQAGDVADRDQEVAQDLVVAQEKVESVASDLEASRARAQATTGEPGEAADNALRPE